MAQNSEQEFQNLMDGVLTLVALLSPEGRVEWQNRAAEGRLYPGESSSGRLLWELQSWGAIPETVALLREGVAMTQQGACARYDVALRRASGAVEAMDFSLVPILDASGRVARLIASATDITERKRAEESLRESEAMFRTLAQTLPGVVFITNSAGRNIYTNLWLQRYTGLDAEQLMGDGWQGIVHPDDMPRSLERLRECLQEVTPFECQHRLRRSDGVYRWHLSRSTPVYDDNGEAVRWLGVCIDIEDQKAAAQELQRSNQDLQQFAYVASHDLQEPLRTVLGFAQLLSRRLKGKMDAESEEFLATVIDGTQRMQRLILDLLDYSRVTQAPHASWATVRFSEVVESALWPLRAQLEERGATVTIGEMPMVQGDFGQLSHVAQNLFSNALKYRHPVNPLEIHLACEQREDEHRFSLRDNGQGFPAEAAERIFGIFKRLHGQDVPGTGIGLAIVKAILERHGGKIWAESAGVGEGSTFWFTLPAAPRS